MHPIPTEISLCGNNTNIIHWPYWRGSWSPHVHSLHTWSRIGYFLHGDPPVLVCSPPYSSHPKCGHRLSERCTWSWQKSISELLIHTDRNRLKWLFLELKQLSKSVGICSDVFWKGFTTRVFMPNNEDSYFLLFKSYKESFFSKFFLQTDRFSVSQANMYSNSILEH